MKAASRSRRILKTILWLATAAILAVMVFAAGMYLWALAAADHSQLARLIAWQEGSIFGEASAEDWRRFPARTIRAAAEPLPFEAAGEKLPDDITIDGKPLATYLFETNTTAFIILRGDELLYEGYFNGTGRDSLLPSLSVAKSFAATLVGIAIDEGLISDMDDPVTDYIPELLDRDRRFGNISLRHLVSMSSGIVFEDLPSPWTDTTTAYWSPDLRNAVLKTKIGQAPALVYQYNDYNTILLGIVLERAAGMSVSEYMETRLWQPMGAEGDASWNLDSEQGGFEQMAVGINARALDYARLGRLYLDKGKAGDRQVVPARWIEEATRMDSTTDPAEGYQYGWFVDVARDGQAFSADGNLGQFIYVYPPADLVLVRLGKNTGGVYWTGLLGDLAQYLEGELAQ